MNSVINVVSYSSENESFSVCCLLINKVCDVGCATCPGNDADPGVDPPEWLGELGRDLKACNAACLFWATIFWAAIKHKTHPSADHLVSNSQIFAPAESGRHSPTLWKHSIHVEAIGGAGLIKQRVTHINAQLPGSLILNHTRVGAADFI